MTRPVRAGHDFGFGSRGWAGCSVAWLCLLSFLALCVRGAVAHEVYLRGMTIHQDHEKGLHGSKPEVYMSCDYDDRGKIELEIVKHTETLYSWHEGQISITYVGNGDCRQCTLKEADWPDKDDTFGTINICAKDFLLPEGMHTYSVEGQFDATMQCKDCVPAAAPALPSALRDINATTLLEEEEEEESEEKQQVQDWTKSTEYKDILRNLSRKANGTNETASWSSSNNTQTGFVHGNHSQAATAVVHSEHHSQSFRAQVSSTTFGDSHAAGGSSPGHKGSGNAVVPVVVILSLTCLVAGAVGGALLYRTHQARKRRLEEEKMQELEAILGDPHVDFERLAVQDNDAMTWNMNRARNWRPWKRVPTQPEKPGDAPQPVNKL